jgi:hypothetical protein
VLYVGLDLSRKRLDWLALDGDGQLAANGAVAPDRDALAKLRRRLGDAPVLAVIESMSGARFVHDQLELAGWDVRIADAVKARGWRRWPARRIGSTAGCWPSSRAATSCPRCGCPTHRCAASGSEHVSGCTWSSTEAR